MTEAELLTMGYERKRDPDNLSAPGGMGAWIWYRRLEADEQGGRELKIGVDEEWLAQMTAGKLGEIEREV